MKNRTPRIADESGANEIPQPNFDIEWEDVVGDAEGGSSHFVTIPMAFLEGLTRAEYTELLKRYRDAYELAMARKATRVEQQDRFMRLIEGVDLD